MLRDAVGGGRVISWKKHYVKFPEKKHYVTLEWPLNAQLSTVLSHNRNAS